MKRTVAAAALLAIGILATAPSYSLTKGDLVGELGSPNSYTRTIEVTSSTRHANVDYSETVSLVVNGQTTTWKFDGIQPVVNLQDIVPGAPKIYVYVKPSDRYQPWSAP
jgi:hypothetical protein